MALDLGHILINDSGIITRRNPDSVRGADVFYISFIRMPRGTLPQSYLDVPPGTDLRGPIAERPMA